ncbi:hypothetical protein N7931_11145 [Catenovulum sp. 2E275]|uniref:hypothetical protein n=1 Tax=Catenovulum sp. 2E275 TaxID=2980497 RepID=UPI0021D27A5F|nr:hypothetical protein [Catenovulum sp. 2E275]MCU4676186.1 hypothetical protein [Catenovulum sp. 2E275]
MLNPKVILINPTLHKIFLSNLNSHLEMKQLREFFIEQTKIKITTDELNKLLYRQLDRLVKQKVIEKKKLGDGKRVVYRSFEGFTDMTFKFKIFAKENERKGQLLGSQTTSEASKSKLERELKQYEIDFQSCIAESEEYKRLFSIVPDMKKVLEQHYLLACNQSNELLGKIKAVKTILQNSVVG